MPLNSPALCANFLTYTTMPQACVLWLVVGFTCCLVTAAVDGVNSQLIRADWRTKYVSINPSFSIGINRSKVFQELHSDTKHVHWH